MKITANKPTCIALSFVVSIATVVASYYNPNIKNIFFAILFVGSFILLSTGIMNEKGEFKGASSEGSSSGIFGFIGGVLGAIQEAHDEEEDRRNRRTSAMTRVAQAQHDYDNTLHVMGFDWKARGELEAAKENLRKEFG